MKKVFSFLLVVGLFVLVSCAGTTSTPPTPTSTPNPTSAGGKTSGSIASSSIASSNTPTSSNGGSSTSSISSISSEETCYVKFNNNGGSNVATQRVVKGQKAEEPNAPTKDGFLFDGWYKDETLQTKWNFATDTVTSNTELYAKWELCFTVTFYTNGGSPMEPVSVKKDSKLTGVDEPTKTGFDFNGWYLDETLQEAFDLDTTIGADIDLYAAWKTKICTVKFETNGGTDITDGKVEYGNMVAPVSNPEKTECVFGGWYSDEALQNEFDFDTKILDDITLYAKWTVINYYNVKFETNGGGSIDTQRIKEDELATKPSDPTKNNSIFGGWYTDEELNNSFDFNTPITKELTLYAKWDIDYTANLIISNNVLTGIKDKSVEKIVVPNTVTQITPGVFNGCSNLVSLELPRVKTTSDADNKLSPVGEYFGKTEYSGAAARTQFHMTTKKNVAYYIPMSLKEIKFNGGKLVGRDLENFVNLESVSFDCTLYFEDTLLGCQNIKSLSFCIEKNYRADPKPIGLFFGKKDSGGVYQYDKYKSVAYDSYTNYYAFSGGSNYAIPGTLKTVEFTGSYIPDAFLNNLSLDNVIINSDIRVGARTFEQVHITNMVVNGIVTGFETSYSKGSITNMLFTSADNLFGCINAATDYDKNDGNILIKHATKAYLIDGDGDFIFENAKYKEIKKLTISGRNLSDKYFKGLSSLEELVINGSSQIGNNCFESCTNLTTVSIDGAIIRNLAFSSCSKLANLTITENTYLTNTALNNLSALKFNTYENGCYLGNNSNPYLYLYELTNKENLTSIKPHKNCIDVRLNAFSGCTAVTVLDTPKLPGTLASLIPSANIITSLTVRSGAISDKACYQSKIKKLVLGDKVTSVGKEAFYNSSLCEVKLSSSCESIGEGAFNKCYDLYQVEFSKGLKYIGKDAFRDSELTEVELPDSVISIGDYAFYRTGKIFSFSMSKNIEVVGKDAVPEDNLKKVTGSGHYVGNSTNPYLVELYATGPEIMDGCRVIASETYRRNYTSESVIMPKSVLYINKDAFLTTLSIKYIYYKGTQEDWALVTRPDFPFESKVYFYSETQPTEAGNYWHYVNDVPTRW